MTTVNQTLVSTTQNLDKLHFDATVDVCFSINLDKTPAYCVKCKDKNKDFNQQLGKMKEQL